MGKLLTMALGGLLLIGCAGTDASNDGGGAGGSGGGGSGSSGGGGGGTPGGGGVFPSTAIFYQDISQAAVDSESGAIMTALQTQGWGGKLGIDVSFSILHAAASDTPRPFTSVAGATPDCDTAPIPVPAGGHIEGGSDYTCQGGGDCHLLVYQTDRLYELYQANITGGMAAGGAFSGTCLVVWDLKRDYWQAAAAGPNYSRGDGCNGADAGDLPMAPLILRPDEISAGLVSHALRFTISNSRIRAAVYVHPATHIGGPTGGATTLPYGARLRLKASFDETRLPSEAARVVARALKKYGMFLADGGNIYLSGTDDLASVISPSALGSLLPSDFEMVDGGPRLTWKNFNCARTAITQ